MVCLQPNVVSIFALLVMSLELAQDASRTMSYMETSATVSDIPASIELLLQGVLRLKLVPKDLVPLNTPYTLQTMWLLNDGLCIA